MTAKKTRIVRKATQKSAPKTERRVHGPSTEAVVADLIKVSPRFREAFDRHSTALVFAEALRQLREDAGLTQKQVAELVGMSQAQVSLLESGGGEQGPTVSTLGRYGRALGFRFELKAVPLKGGND
jgi:DNA-binding XRE family transcriptional regulator